jgi:uncharacterized protein YjbI with pentapeptide repeats
LTAGFLEGASLLAGAFFAEVGLAAAFFTGAALLAGFFTGTGFAGAFFDGAGLAAAFFTGAALVAGFFTGTGFAGAFLDGAGLAVAWLVFLAAGFLVIDLEDMKSKGNLGTGRQATIHPLAGHTWKNTGGRNEEGMKQCVKTIV